MPNGNVGQFQRARDRFESFEQFAAEYRDLRLTPQALRRLYEKMKRDKLYLSEFYQVAVDKDPPHAFPGAMLWHLSIKRLDKEPIHDWRDLQAIKAQLCGDEAEAIELYPAKSRTVDTSNQFHLWVFMRMSNLRLPRLPVGWQSGVVLDEAATGKAKQRPKLSAAAKDAASAAYDEEVSRALAQADISSSNEGGNEQ
jgi:hypothetical protein